MSKHSHDYNLGLYDKDGKFNEKRHEELTGKKYPYTHLDNEIDMHTPDTSWHSVLVATVSIIAAGFLIYAVTIVISLLW